MIVNGALVAGGPATLASLNRPNQAWPDGAGGVYIADTGNDVIRLVFMDGTSELDLCLSIELPQQFLPSLLYLVSTVAGQPPPAAAGYSGDGGLAVNARLNSPTGVTVDASTGYVYVTDRDNHVVSVLSS